MAEDRTKKPLRFGWTTGACATAALKAALYHLFGDTRLAEVEITLPRGENPRFQIAHAAADEGSCEVGIIKDAGDDPDVTHGVMIIVKVRPGAPNSGLCFFAGEGVGTVTKKGLPIPVGEPAINPAPRQMMTKEVHEAAAFLNFAPDLEITISIPGGAEIAKKTWNGRLGIEGGLSILGTTGVVRPFSCAAWISSIHRGIDVARAEGLDHVAGTTGATSEAAVQALYGLPDIAMLDMGDFYGGMVKYLAKNPIARVSIGGGIGKIAKLAQGAVDLHSGRSTVDFEILNDWSMSFDGPELRDCNTALEAFERAGPPLAERIAQNALARAKKTLPSAQIDIIVIDRSGRIVGHAT